MTNYKAIAEIMNYILLNFYEDNMIEGCKRLADYFEKEDTKTATKIYNSYLTKNGVKVSVKDFKKFNRKQFYKWCGIKNE